MMGWEGQEVTPQIRSLIEDHHLGSIILTTKNLQCKYRKVKINAGINGRRVVRFIMPENPTIFAVFDCNSTDFMDSWKSLESLQFSHQWYLYPHISAIVVCKHIWRRAKAHLDVVLDGRMGLSITFPSLYFTFDLRL